MITRRDFAIRTAVLTMLASSPACLFSDIYKTISNYVPVALLAFDRIIAILVEHGLYVSLTDRGVSIGGIAEAIDRVKAALADIQSAVLEFRDAHEKDKQTFIHVIAVALKIATGRLVEFWELLKIPNEHLARTVKLLLDVIISTLTGFIAQLAPGTPVATQHFVSGPKVRTIKQFREEFNEVLRERDEGQYAI